VPKRPGWSLAALHDACLGRSHRSAAGKAKLREVLDARVRSSHTDDYRIAVVPASDTGARRARFVVAARGARRRPAGLGELRRGWVTDTVKQLKLGDARIHRAAYGELPDLAAIDRLARRRLHLERHHLGGSRARWRVDQGRPPGLTICDATSAAFAMDLPWPKLDVVPIPAEGARRRGGAWHAGAEPARRRPARELHAALAAAQALPA